MADNTQAPAKGRLGWLKVTLGTVGGLFSGACVMYLTPLVDRVIKPGKPVANFSYQADGLTVRFQNLSAGGQGWWDFGDGSALEPVSADREFVSHTYKRSGDYNVKMSVRNILGDDNERSVLVRLDTGTASAAAEGPRVLALEATPVSPGSFAPATFKVAGKVSNTQLCVWTLGDDHPLEISPGNDAERIVTFPRPGGYIIKLAAINGTQHDEKTEIVTVLEPPAGTVTAVLTVADSGTRLEKSVENKTFATTFPPDHKADAYPIDRQIEARPGRTIVDMQFTPGKGKPPVVLGDRTEMALDPASLGLSGVRNLRLTVASDRKTARLTGELVRDAAAAKGQKPLPTLALPVSVTEQRRAAANRAPVSVTSTLYVPAAGVTGSATLALPAVPSNWIDVQRKLKLELKDGNKVLWQETQLPKSAGLVVQRRPCTIAARRDGEKVRIDLLEGASPPGN